MSIFGKLFKGEPPNTPEPVFALLLLQHEPAEIGERYFHELARRAWGKAFLPGDPDWWVVPNVHRFATINAGPYQYMVSQCTHPEWDDDKASGVLPPLQERNVWGPYGARFELHYVTAKDLPPQTRMAVLARTALALIDGSTLAVVDRYTGEVMPMSESTVERLQALAASLPPV